MANKHNFLYKIIALILVLSITLTSAGCNNNEFKTINVTKRGVRFTFECPSSYLDRNHTLDSEMFQGSLLLERVDTDNTWDNSNTTFTIGVSDRAQYSNAQGYIDYLIQDFKTAGSEAQINIINRSPIQIAGNTGEYFTYTETLSSSSHLLIYATYDHDNFIWILRMDAFSSISDQAKSEFDHIVKSLKYLD